MGLRLGACAGAGAGAGAAAGARARAGPSSKVTVRTYVVVIPPISGQDVMPCRESQADGIRNLPPLAQTWTTEFLTSAALGVRAACSVLCPLYPGRRTSRSHAWRVLPGGFRGDTQSRTMRPHEAGRGTVYLHTICGPARPPPWRARRRGPGYFRSHMSGNVPNL